MPVASTHKSALSWLSLSQISRKLKNSRLARDAGHLSIGQTVRLASQAASFFVLARMLGPKLYGEFVAMTALVAILYPFSGFGTNVMFLKNVKSGKRSPSLCWGNGLLLIGLTGTAFTLATLAANRLTHFGMPTLGLGCICLGELIFARTTDLAGFGFAAIGQLKQMSAQNSFLGLLRLAAILLLWISTHTSSLEAWCALYLLTGILGALYAFWKTSKTWDWPTCEISSMLKDAKEGTLFSASESARNIYNDIDKTMLGHLAGFGSAGIYGAAYRIIDVSLTPVRSILTAAFPEMFRRGAGGLRATYSYALTMIKRASLAGLVICFALLLGAPLVSMLIGSQYTDATYAIRLLAPIPLLRCVHLFLADALSGAGLQRVRLMIQASVALLNIGVNLIILPTWSWRGAAWTSVGCDAVLALVIWLTVLMLLRTEESRTEAIGG